MGLWIGVVGLAVLGAGCGLDVLGMLGGLGGLGRLGAGVWVGWVHGVGVHGQNCRAYLIAFCLTYSDRPSFSMVVLVLVSWN